MANLMRYACPWTGSPVVGGGVSTFYLAEGHVGGTAAIAAFFVQVGSGIPPGVTVSVPATGDLMDVASGALTGTWTNGTAAAVTSTGTGVYAAGVGFRFVWPTNGIRRGRRVRGSTFLVPLTAANYQSDGSILETTRAGMLAAAVTLASTLGSDFKIWSRPVGGAGGQANEVVGAQVPDKVSWLRSRRT
jgi:hypothetical protein